MSAGYLDVGEDPAATAAREALEETHLAVEITHLVDVFPNPPGQAGRRYSFCTRRVWSGVSYKPGRCRRRRFSRRCPARTRVRQHRAAWNA
ncbi:MAG: NUDIX domain-containing protein [Gammaproteobacteria bacterium]